jgi:hypothetical protein
MYKKALISIIKFLAVDLNEIVVSIPLEDITFDSIEWVKPSKVILHKMIGDLDVEYDFDDLDDLTKREIYVFLVKNYL